MEITYTLVGDYYRPNLVAPESPKVGRWGMLRFNYLRKHQEALYAIMEHFEQELIEYIDYYNNKRIKARLKGLPPALHRQQALSAV